MTCHDAREQFSALVDDALTVGERAALDAHLATCADCRRELQRFRDTVSLVCAVAPVRAPAGFVDRVLEAARPVSWPRRLVRGLFLPWPVKLPMEAAAVVLVAVGVALVYRGTPELELATRLEQPVPVVAQTPEGAAPTVATHLPPHPTSLESRVDAPRDQAPAKDQAQALAKREAKEALEPPKATKLDASAPAKAQQPEELSSRDADVRQEVDRRAKQETPPAFAERRTMTSGNVQAPRAPGALADNYAQAPPPPPAAASSALAPPPDVFGQLAVSDRDEALRKVSELVARLGAAETRRIEHADGLTLELTIPRDAYAELSRELARLGRWQPTREPAALPAQVRVVLRISG
jgi:hypothetical protein